MTLLLKLLGGTLVVLVAFFIAGWIVTRGDYPVAKTVAEDPSLPSIEIDGYRFHGETFGDQGKPVVVVVHGGPGWDYRSLLPLKALADDYFVVFYDQRGTGLSPRVAAEQLTLDSTLNDLDMIIDLFRGEGRVSLIGHSWGAMVVTAYLGRAPAKVSHAVLAEPGFLTPETFRLAGVHMGPRWEGGYLWFVAGKWFESLHIDGPDGEAAKDYFLAEAAAAANPEYYCGGMIPEAATRRWRAGSTAMGAIVKPFMDGKGGLTLDLTQGLQNFKPPVLLLASECNALIGIEQQRRHQRFFNESRLEIIPRSGHMMLTEQAELSLQAIRGYLAEQHDGGR